MICIAKGTCECGCGEPTPIVTRTYRAKGHVKGRPMRFVNGHQNRSRRLSAETRAKLSAANKGKAFSPETRVKISEALKGSGHPNWKGGRTVEAGYVFLQVGRDHPMAGCNGRVFEHRLVIAERIGRMLDSEEVAHHVNEARGDNRPENLWLFPDRASHTAWHHMQDKGGELAVRMAAIPLGAT